MFYHLIHFLQSESLTLHLHSIPQPKIANLTHIHVTHTWKICKEGKAKIILESHHWCNNKKKIVGNYAEKKCKQKPSMETQIEKLP